MQNLIRDIETFRDHLKKAEVCACKMQKYDSTSVEAKVCAEDVTDAAVSISIVVVLLSISYLSINFRARMNTTKRNLLIVRLEI